MKYDIAGNQIIEPMQNCRCGLTGGCEKCNPKETCENLTNNEWEKKFDKQFLMTPAGKITVPFAAGIEIKSFIRTIRDKAIQEGYNRGRVKHCQQTHQHLIDEAKQTLREEIIKIKERFRCAACDGAKCEHTQCCQALNLAIEIIKKI